MSVIEKQVIINVYNPSGSFIKSWKNFQFDGFTQEINAGLGECVITLAEVFDYDGTELVEGNDVEIRISDKETRSTTPDTAASRVIYSGYISLIERQSYERSEQIVVHLLGHYTKLALDILKNGTTTTLNTDATTGVGTGAAAAADVGLVMRGIIDRYRAENTNPKINYTTSTIPLVGSDMNYSFEQKTYREAVDKVLGSSASGYYFFVDANGLMTFTSKATTATHKFIFGRHFNRINVQRSLEKMRNFLLVWDGASIYNHYQDDNSIAIYGRRADRLSDTGILDSTTADLIGNKFIAENKDPDVKVVCEILDSNGHDTLGYDIESIKVGDTCSFFGFNSTLADIFKENMLITRVDYELHKVRLMVELVRSSALDVQYRTNKKVEDIQTSGSPATYS